MCFSYFKLCKDNPTKQFTACCTVYVTNKMCQTGNLEHNVYIIIWLYGYMIVYFVYYMT